jgi:hypothetical protein
MSGTERTRPGVVVSAVGCVEVCGGVACGLVTLFLCVEARSYVNCVRSRALYALGCQISAL